MSHNLIKKKISSPDGLCKIENFYRDFIDDDLCPLAIRTPYKELAEVVIPDKTALWSNPLVFFSFDCNPAAGIKPVRRTVQQFILDYSRNTEILSISSGMKNNRLHVVILLRIYDNNIPNPDDIIKSIEAPLKPVRDDFTEQKKKSDSYTNEEIRNHLEKIHAQDEALKLSTESVPFLSAISKYERRELPKLTEDIKTYDLLTKDMQIATILEYNEFVDIFRQCMQYITSVERDTYYSVIRNSIGENEFFTIVDSYIYRTFISSGRLSVEDLPALKNKLYKALFKLYIVQDLIDDPDITDIKITSPDSIRVRIKGKAYLSNITFIDIEDYFRFIQAIAIRASIDPNLPIQTFTDSSDDNYILRFTLTAGYITSDGFPIIHIRKVSRKKMLADDLINAGMMDEKIRDYLLDCGRYSRGVVFAGPPGSGKTVMLNWFLEEAYEDSAEVLVIQENDELFSYKKGMMFEHVINNPAQGETACSLEELGQLALVAGANVFVIGEAKGAEICSAITLSNSGCRTALTIHSPSSVETIDKMADLAMRGYAKSYSHAKRMIKSFQTIVYLQDFKVQEISEIIGYDDDKDDMIYRPIYRRN